LNGLLLPVGIPSVHLDGPGVEVGVFEFILWTSQTFLFTVIFSVGHLAEVHRGEGPVVAVGRLHDVPLAALRPLDASVAAFAQGPKSGPDAVLPVGRGVAHAQLGLQDELLTIGAAVGLLALELSRDPPAVLLLRHYEQLVGRRLRESPGTPARVCPEHVRHVHAGLVPLDLVVPRVRLHLDEVPAVVGRGKVTLNPEVLSFYSAMLVTCKDIILQPGH